MSCLKIISLLSMKNTVRKLFEQFVKVLFTFFYFFSQLNMSVYFADTHAVDLHQQ